MEFQQRIKITKISSFHLLFSENSGILILDEEQTIRREEMTSSENAEIMKYEYIARDLARTAHKNCIYSEEDIYQELMLKMVLTWKYIKSWNRDPKYLIKKILYNRSSDIINYCQNRPDTSWYTKESSYSPSDDSEFSILDDCCIENTFTDGSKFPDPEEFASFNELLEILAEIRDNSNDESISEFLSSIIDEEKREKIECLNDEYLKKAKRKVDKAYIPPFLRAKLIGRSVTFAYRVMFAVKDVLLKRGYEQFSI